MTASSATAAATYAAGLSSGCSQARKRPRCRPAGRGRGGCARRRCRRCRPAAWSRSRANWSADAARARSATRNERFSRCIWTQTSSAIRTSAEWENAPKSRSVNSGPGVVGRPLLGRVDRVEARASAARDDATSGQRRDRRGLGAWVSSMITVQAQCGCRSADDRGGRWIGRTCARALVATAVASKVGSSMSWHIERDVVRAHRLDVHQRAAVVELELAVPRVVDGVPEVHELRRRADVELEPLEDRHHVGRPRSRAPAASAGCRSGDAAGPLLDRDLRHLLAPERGDAPRHAGAVDQLADQQQLGQQDGQLRRARARSTCYPTERSPVQYCARRAFLSGLPSPVSGRASVTMTCFGDCTAPLRSLTAA